MGKDLSREADIDFSVERLDYAAFRQLALNPNIDVHNKIGYPTAYREGREPAVFNDILSKLPMLAGSVGKTVIDIGPGCANLPRMMIDLCVRQGHRLVLVDSPEMLAQLPDVEGVTFKCPGAFPQNRAEVVSLLLPQGADTILAYGVLNVVFVDSNPFEFVDEVSALLAPGGRALIGEIPNNSKRRRFFASDAGKAFHRAFTGRDEDPLVTFNTPAAGIDDAVLMALMQRVQLAGRDGYLLPQAQDLPMANRRDDLLIVRP